MITAGTARGVRLLLPRSLKQVTEKESGQEPGLKLWKSNKSQEQGAGPVKESAELRWVCTGLQPRYFSNNQAAKGHNTPEGTA